MDIEEQYSLEDYDTRQQYTAPKDIFCRMVGIPEEHINGVIKAISKAIKETTNDTDGHLIIKTYIASEYCTNDSCLMFQCLYVDLTGHNLKRVGDFIEFHFYNQVKLFKDYSNFKVDTLPKDLKGVFKILPVSDNESFMESL